MEIKLQSIKTKDESFGVDLVRSIHNGRFSVIEWRRYMRNPMHLEGSRYGIRTQEEASIFFNESKERLFPQVIEG